MSTEQSATPVRSIDDQIIAVNILNAAGLCDVAEWIQRQAVEKVDKKIEDLGEPRKCVQTVNRFGFPLHACCGNDLHPPYSACNATAEIYKPTCSHHEPLYAVPLDPPTPEPSRSDAVKEAIALIDAHPDCKPGVGYCSIRCPAAFFRPLVAALADAEQESAHYKDELAAATKRERAYKDRLADAERKREIAEELYAGSVAAREISDNRLRDLQSKFGLWDNEAVAAHMEFVVHVREREEERARQLADAEKRAKDAEDRIAFHRCKPPLGNPTREEAMAQNIALTRKLATALPIVHWAAEQGAYPLREAAKKVLAAIDAPAQESKVAATFTAEEALERAIANDEAAELCRHIARAVAEALAGFECAGVATDCCLRMNRLCSVLRRAKEKT
jgi:hypothetical protein